MPTYQYACTECGHRFEAVQAFTDDSLTECPECHGKLRKVYGSVGVVFKGSGFYRNDSRSDAKTGASASSAAGGSTDKSDSAGTGTKTEPAKTESAKPAASSSSSSSSSASSSSSSSAGGSGASSTASTSRAAG